MENELINTSCISSFIKRVQNAELQNDKEVRLNIKEAKTLTYTLSLVMTRLTGKLEDLYVSKKLDNNEEIIKITMDGGKGW
jgi:hypothetical protein